MYFFIEKVAFICGFLDLLARDHGVNKLKMNDMNENTYEDGYKDT